MSRTRPPMLLGPSGAHTWLVLFDALLAAPICFDCATACETAASGMEPSALARWRYIHSSAPTGLGVGANQAVAVAVAPSPSDPVTTPAHAPTRAVSAVATTIGTAVTRLTARASPPWRAPHCV